MSETIQIRGAREHNLRDVSLTLGRHRLICFTGVSGSGKSSLAFDTLFAEGQRRYIESLSAYARQFLAQLPKPDVDAITGLSPAIAIQQKTSGWNPRSTVGTITQIHDFLRVLFARVGRQHCPGCGRPIQAQTRDQIIGHILQMPEGSRITILAPVARKQKGEFRDTFEDLRRQGFSRVRVDGAIVLLAEPPSLSKNLRHDIEVVIDRLVLSSGARPRLAEAVETALRIGKGTLVVSIEETGKTEIEKDGDEGKVGSSAAGTASASRRRRDMSLARDRATAPDGDIVLSSEYACGPCGLSFEPPSPQMLSFNSPQGMCRQCDGLGRVFDFDPNLIVSDVSKSVLNGAIEPMRSRPGRWQRHILEGVARYVGFDLKTPWKDLPARARHALLHGTGDAHITFEWRTRGGVYRHGGKFQGLLAQMHESYRKAQSGVVRGYYEKYMREGVCPLCDGSRLTAQAAAIRLGGRSIVDVCACSIDEAMAFVDGLELSGSDRIIAEQVLREVRLRLKFLQDVGLNYLTLDRPAPTLSGGESQRIRLASQIGSGLTGVLYILDEPSIGLHPRDNRRLLASLQRLRDMGNTVIVVEHDEETMRAADEIVDFGPGPGVRGGQVVAQGPLETICTAEGSLTGDYLSGRRSIPIPTSRRPVSPVRRTERRAACGPRSVRPAGRGKTRRVDRPSK